MRTDDLLLRVECYVAVRKALGYAVRSEEKLLKDFVQFLELNGAASPIRAQTAIEWACAPAPGRGPSGEASRLKVVRRFLSHLQAFEFETEVPGPGVLPAFRRPLPYLYSSDEIAALMKEASHLGPKDSLRPYTYVAFSSCLRRVITSAIGHVGTRSLGSLTVLGFASAQALVGPAFIPFDMLSRSVGWSNGTAPELTSGIWFPTSQSTWGTFNLRIPTGI